MNKFSLAIYIISPLITAAVVLVGFVVLTKTAVLHTTSDRTFDVQGVGKVKVVPDKYTTNFSISEDAKTQKEAKDAANSKQNKALEVLRKLGFEDRDIKTSAFSINPQYDYTTGRNVTNGYTASINTTVTSKENAKITAAIDQITEIGINVSGVDIITGDSTQYKAQARLKAIADARQKAQELADASGFALGDIASISENDTPSYQPQYMATDKTMGGVANEKTTINPGEQEVIASVNITYYIK